MLDIELSTDGWLDAVPNTQANLIRQMLESGSSEEQIAESWLSNTGATTTSGFGVGGPIQTFFGNVKAEFVDFVCGGDKYAAERSQAQTIWKEHGKIGLVAMIAAAIAPHVGLAAAAILPVIALLMSLATKVSLNAFCKTATKPI
jgi:hypothetical protein